MTNIINIDREISVVVICYCIVRTALICKEISGDLNFKLIEFL